MDRINGGRGAQTDGECGGDDNRTGRHAQPRAGADQQQLVGPRSLGKASLRPGRARELELLLAFAAQPARTGQSLAAHPAVHHGARPLGVPVAPLVAK